MTPRQHETFEPVTLGHFRGHGCVTFLSTAHRDGATTSPRRLHAEPHPNLTKPQSCSTGLNGLTESKLLGSMLSALIARVSFSSEVLNLGLPMGLERLARRRLDPVPVGNLRSEILVMQSAQNRHRQRATHRVNGTRDRRVLVQR